jgi:hypothetical protein
MAEEKGRVDLKALFRVLQVELSPTIMAEEKGRVDLKALFRVLQVEFSPRATRAARETGTHYEYLVSPVVANPSLPKAMKACLPSLHPTPYDRD